MNIQQLRQSLRLKWVNYYYKNRSWLAKMKIWATYDGQRRPSSGFILATLSTLEPQLEQLLPFILELNNNPDRIIIALGLNFNPEEQLHLVKDNFVAENQEQSESSSHEVTTEKPSSRMGDSVKPCGHSYASRVASRRELALSAKQDRATLPTEREHQFSSVNDATSKTKKPASSITHVSAVRSKFPASSISGSKVVEPIPIATKVQNKSKLIIPITLTKANNNSVLSIAVAGIEAKSKPLTSAAVATKTEYKANGVVLTAATSTIERKSLLSTAVDSEGQSKTKLVDIHSEMTGSPKNRSCRLANWIDDFCQGKEWDREEAGFTPF